ncbi:MAG: hypothetical protein RXR82_06285 [Nitrososphaeria archaeon]
MISSLTPHRPPELLHDVMDVPLDVLYQPLPLDRLLRDLPVRDSEAVFAVRADICMVAVIFLLALECVYDLVQLIRLRVVVVVDVCRAVMLRPFPAHDARYRDDDIPTYTIADSIVYAPGRLPLHMDALAKVTLIARRDVAGSERLGA